MKLFKSLLLLLLPALMFTACSKKNGDGEVQVKMVDAPAVFSEINIEIESVELYNEPNARKEAKGWKPITTNAGVYNILEFQNGNQADITSSTTLKSGKITQLKLVLGTDNTVRTSGLNFDLALDASASFEVIVDLDVEIEADAATEIIIDFDGENSVFGDAQSGFSLNPAVTFVSSSSADIN